MYGTHATDIVGYSYQADIHCPPCIVDIFRSQGRTKVAPTSIGVEAALNHAAQLEGVNREDERSFDSAEFPKVIFGSQVESSDERCGGCGEPLIDNS